MNHENSDQSPKVFDPDSILAEFGGRQTFSAYANHLLAKNAKINLVSRATSPADLFRLIADCLVPLSQECQLIVPAPGDSGRVFRIADIGSGGGLPGIPLALALKFCAIESHLTLVERTGKKARFLRNAMEALNLKGDVISEDFLTSFSSIRTGARETAEDLVTLRWVRPDSRLIRGIASITKPTGRFVYYAPLPQELSVQTDWSVSSLIYTLASDNRDSRTLTVLKRR